MVFSVSGFFALYRKSRTGRLERNADANDDALQIARFPLGAYPDDVARRDATRAHKQRNAWPSVIQQRHTLRASARLDRGNI